MQQKAQTMIHHTFLRRLCWLVGAVAVIVGAPTQAREDAAGACRAAAARAARASDVPYAVLAAIMLTETGRTRGGELQAWPWTVNMEGAGNWFDDRDSALSFAFAAYGRGARSFDVGCFQINYRWHHQNFASLEAMFDPDENAAYAARFLSDLYRETGDWSRAAGAYHSRTETLATRYRARFDRIRAGVDPASPDVVAARMPVSQTVAPVRANTFPLLRASDGRAALGSLVRLGGGG